MPRPKRAKVASKAGRVAATSKTAEAAPSKQQPTKAQATTISASSKSLSDDSDGLVVKATRPRRRMPWHPAPQEGADFTMTGALPHNTEEDVPVSSAKKRTPLSKTPRTQASTGGAKSSSIRRSPVVAIPKSTRSTRSARPSGVSQEDDSSGFGDNLLSFISFDSDSPAHGTRPPSAIKVGVTPAHETSILALTNFKRRPRQPSLLRMVHRTTDVEDNDLDDLDNLDDFDDFHPDAESTPLHVQKSAPKEGANDSGVNLSSSGSRGTKRKLTPVVQVPRSSPPYDSSPELEDSRSPSPSLPDVIQSTEEAHVDKDQEEPEILSQTLAPPMSSSDVEINDNEDLPESPVRPVQRNRRGGRIRNGEGDSDGAETEPARKGRGRPKSKRNQGISTAKLQALLPRRRTHAAQEDDEEETTFDSDQDELALPPRRHAASSRKQAVLKTTKKTPRTAKKLATSIQPKSKNTRTYGRRGSSDKENEVVQIEESDDEEGIIEAGSTIEVLRKLSPPSKSLEAIAKKFEDIDAFEMDFESVSYVQTSSSPVR